MINHKEVYCDEVIISSILRRGDGKFTPIRTIIQVFKKDGTLIAEYDPCIEELYNKDMKKAMEDLMKLRKELDELKALKK